MTVFNACTHANRKAGGVRALPWLVLRLSVFAALVFSAGCSRGESGPSAPKKPRVSVDGSSTLGPLLDVAKDLFGEQRSDIDLQVATSGTNNGFKRLLSQTPGQSIDICKASRPIAPEEVGRAAEMGLEFIELPIALDGIAVVVHPSNTFCEHLTHEELKRIWEPDSRINNWKDIREGFADLPLKLFGAGPQSGTFDVFTELVVGKVKHSRRDYIASESDHVLVVGVAGEKGALGYFGFSYFEANADKLRDVPLVWGSGPPVRPTKQTIRDGSYPLARPTFLYVRKESAERPEVLDFLRFVLRDPAGIVEHPRVRSVALSDEMYEVARARLEQRVGGTVFADRESARRPLGELYLGQGR
jgi:phosphate transport system substrate-binding protein